MNTRLGLWRMYSLTLILFTIIGCGSFSSVRPKSTLVPLGKGNGNSTGNGGAGPGGDSNNNSNSQNPNSISTLQVTETPEATPTDLADILAGPYTVRQTETLGKEKLGSPAGGVCVYSTWQVPVNTPQVSFAFIFGPYSTPTRNTGNTFGYAYNIPSAGESHLAQGNYMLTSSKDGTLKVSITVRDHVTFKGFDGIMPVRYQFDLVPIGGSATCP